MAVTFAIGPNPKWYFVDNGGRPLSGGKFFTYSNLDKQQLKLVYTDANGNFPYPDPIIIDANGTIGPIFFRVDSLNPADSYFIVVQDANGNLMWTVEDYLPSGGSGGGGTTGVDLENLITNNVFWRHTDTIVSPVPTYSLIAPSNNAALVNNLSNGTNNAAPDIVFLKNNTSATDTISFPLFTLGDQPISGDIAPVDYLKYACTVAGSGETTKCLQFPITAKVQNLSNVDVIGTFWARANGGLPQQVILQWFQYFGDGAGASAPVITNINTFSLTNDWVKYSFSDTVPSVTGKNLGGPNNEGPNDGLFLRMQLPLSPNTCNIDLTKFTLYVGNVLSNVDFHSYDEIDGIISSPRTGDVRTALNAFVPYGWVPCNDGVISNADAGIVIPTLVPRSRANADTYPLYYLIWNLTSGYPTFAPIYDSTGVLTTRGASAIADFSANKQLSLTKMLGRVLAGANPLTIASQTFTTDFTTDIVTVGDASVFPTGTPVLLSNTGGALPSPLATTNVPNVYYAIYLSATTLKFAASVDLAQAGAAINLTDNGTGTHTIQTALGTYFGEGYHTLTIAEMPSHNHEYYNLGNVGNAGSTVPASDTGLGSFTQNTGGGLSHNTMQPMSFLNVFLKL